MSMSHPKYFTPLHGRMSLQVFCALVLPVMLSACFSEDKWSDQGKTVTPATDALPAGTVGSAAVTTTYGTRTIDWNARAHDAYSLDEAQADFGNILYGWQEEKLFNSNGTCRVKLLKNSLSAACGVISKIAIAPGSEYEMQFDVNFHSAFDWSRGGKVGFGFSIGDGFSGCNPAWSGEGGTARLTWYQDDNGNVYFQPYVYYKDQPDSCGNKFGKKYPASGSLQKAHWYTVKLYVKSNTGTQTNGRLKLTIEDTVVLNQAIRWTTNDSKRLINAIYFSTFRGGGQAYWQSTTDGFIYFDNLRWTKLAE
jgi:hypothetical protein